MPTRKEIPSPPDHSEAWRERAKAALAAQLEAGGTLYGRRKDGAYVARTKAGDRVIEPPKPNKS